MHARILQDMAFAKAQRDASGRFFGPNHVPKFTHLRHKYSVHVPGIMLVDQDIGNMVLADMVVLLLVFLLLLVPVLVPKLVLVLVLVLVVMGRK